MLSIDIIVSAGRRPPKMVIMSMNYIRILRQRTPSPVDEALPDIAIEKTIYPRTIDQTAWRNAHEHVTISKGFTRQSDKIYAENLVQNSLLSICQIAYFLHN